MGETSGSSSSHRPRQQIPENITPASSAGRLRGKTEASSGPEEELLGSLTTYNGVQGGESSGPAVRTSARVIKKMRQEEAPEKDKPETAKPKVDKVDKAESSIAPSRIVSSSVAKQRMPKALWSTAEKNLFFEALNEYGKDFDSITAYICNKMKKKGVPDTTAKTKHQVSHFYYRTWHKVSKHIKFNDNVKKMVQELYSLINFGEMRKRLVSRVRDPRVARLLPELVRRGAVAVKTRGKNLRVRTPVCRALRRLNMLEDGGERARLPARVCVVATARDMEAWARVQAVARNPRAIAPAPPSCRLDTLIALMQRHWRTEIDIAKETLSASPEKQSVSNFDLLDQQINTCLNPGIQNPLLIEIDKPSVASNAAMEESTKVNKTLTSNCDKNPDSYKNTKNHLGILLKNPDISNDEKSNKNVLSKDGDDLGVTASNTDDNDRLHEEDGMKNARDQETEESSKKCVVRQGFKGLVLHVGPKPGLKLHLPTVHVSEHITSQRICLASYQERLLRNNSANHPNGLQNGVGFKGGGSRFKEKKRQRKDSGDNEANDKKKSKPEQDVGDKPDIFDHDETANDGMDMTVVFSDTKGNNAPDDLKFDDKSLDDRDFHIFREKDKDSFSELEDDDKYNAETDGGESDAAARKTEDKKDKKTAKFSKLKIKLKVRKKKDVDPVVDPAPLLDCPDDHPQPILIINNQQQQQQQQKLQTPTPLSSDFFRKSWNQDLLEQQAKKGWSVCDAGDLTVGDLYLMFGSDSKLELNYWWAEATSPIPTSIIQQLKQGVEQHQQAGNAELDTTNAVEEEVAKAQVDKEILDSGMLSPVFTSSQDSNDGEEKKGEISSPDYKGSHRTTTHDDPNTETSIQLVSKMINNPYPNGAFPPSLLSPTTEAKHDTAPVIIVPQRERVVSIAARLAKLLSLSKLHNKRGRVVCPCGHVCTAPRNRRLLNEHPFSMNEKFTNSRASVPIIPSLRNTLASSSASPASDELQNSEELGWGPQYSKGPAGVNQRDVFRTPFARGLLIPRVPAGEAEQTAFNSDNMPKSNRRGRQARRSEKPLSTPRIAPLLPWSGGSARAGAAPPTPVYHITSSPFVRVKLLPTVTRAAPPNIAPAKPKEVLPPKEVTPPEDKLFLNDSAKNVLIGNNSLTDSDLLPSSEVSSIWKSATAESIVAADNKSSDTTPDLGNFLELSLPSNIGDDNSLEVSNLKLGQNGKHDNFTGLLQTETMSMSPSHLLKENDDHWLESEVHNFSLSSFLGHLEGAQGSGRPTPRLGGSNSLGARATDETVDTQLQCMMSETSIDYMAKFEDLAARVTAETSK